MRPIHQLALDMEHVLLARTYRSARTFCTYGQASVFCRGCLHLPHAKCATAKARGCVQQEAHTDGTKVFRVRDAEPRLIISHVLPVTDPTERITHINDNPAVHPIQKALNSNPTERIRQQKSNGIA